MTAPTVAERIAALPRPSTPELPAPKYRGKPGPRILLGLECFERHMTDEGHQLQQGLAEAGYDLWGPYFENDERNVGLILALTNPSVVIMQDKREWDKNNGSCLDPTAGFEYFEKLADDPSIFKLTICKDAHGYPEYHSQASAEIGCHAWICYYHPDIVHHVAPWTRRQHLVRTYHSLNVAHVAPFLPAGERKRCLVSGAASDLYLLRQRVIANAGAIGCDTLRHPGYHARGSHTERFFQTLNQYKVSICTASLYGYSLRKLIESTAAGCVVVTDLPPDDPLPQIDDNLVRIHPQATIAEIKGVVDSCAEGYSEERQRHFAARAQAFYDYRRRGRELAGAIEEMRRGYGA